MVCRFSPAPKLIWVPSMRLALVLEPQLVCNPGANLKSGQYFNPACFAPPNPGQNGTLIWPIFHGPAYFDSDLTLSKRFKITERQAVEFRVSAFNFLNHPNPQFGLGGTRRRNSQFRDYKCVSRADPNQPKPLNYGFPGAYNREPGSGVRREVLLLTARITSLNQFKKGVVTCCPFII